MHSAFHLSSVKFWAKIAFFGYFWVDIRKKDLLSHLKLPQIVQNAKFCGKLKILKLRTKIVSFGCFRQQFSKTIVTFEINALDFV